MQPHLAQMLWRLRGARPPAEHVLQRLYDLHPQYRLGFTPATLDRVTPATPDKVVGGLVIPGRPGSVVPGRPPLWWIYDTRPHNAHDAARRRAGAARLQRWTRASVAYRAQHPATPAQCEEMIAGLWVVGSWPPDPLPARDHTGRVLHVLTAFGSDQMFRELAEGERAFQEAAARLERELRLDETADEEVRAEYEENPEYRASLRDGYHQLAKEDWALVFRDRTGVLMERAAPWKETGDAGTHG